MSPYLLFPAVWAISAFAAISWLWKAALNADSSISSLLGAKNQKDTRRALRRWEVAIPILLLLFLRVMAALWIVTCCIALLMTAMGHYLGLPSGPLISYGRWGQMEMTTTFISHMKILWYEIMRSIPILELDTTFGLKPPSQPSDLSFRVALMLVRIVVVLIPFSIAVRAADSVRSSHN